MYYNLSKKVVATLTTIIIAIICLVNENNLNAEIVYENDTHIIDLWNKYYNKVDDDKNTSFNNYRIVGTINDEIDELIKTQWAYKNLTYEIYFDNQAELANTIYNLAIFVNDISNEVTIERFQKGVQGFHYHINQICDWLNSNKDLTRDIDKLLYIYLLEDNVIKNENGVILPTGRINHVLGIAYNKKRKMKSIANHEQIHILWDEDQSIKQKYTDLWNKFSDSEKDEIIAKLKGYSKDNESQLIEEWAVREIEKIQSN